MSQYFTVRSGYGLLGELIQGMLKALGFVVMPKEEARHLAYHVAHNNDVEGYYYLRYIGTLYTQEDAEIIWKMSETLSKIVDNLPVYSDQEVSV